MPKHLLDTITHPHREFTTEISLEELEQHKPLAEKLTLSNGKVGGTHPMAMDSQLEETNNSSYSKTNDPVMVNLTDSVSQILRHLEDGVLREQRRAEWRMLGALVDRVLLIILIIAATITTVNIYAIAPVAGNSQSES